MTTGQGNGGYVRRMFAQDIASDLKEGRLPELAEIYALDAVSDAERMEIEGFLAHAPEAQRTAFLDRVRAARETLIASFTAEEEPPAALLDRIIDSLPDQRTDAPAAGTAAPTAEQTAPTKPDPAANPPAVSDLPADSDLPAVSDLAPVSDLAAARQHREERRRLTGVRAWLVAAAAAALVAVGGVGIGSFIANQNDPVNQVLQAQDVRQATVQVSGGGTATVSVSSSRDAIVVRMNDVPAPSPGKVYQLWLIPKDGSAPVSQGLMDTATLSKPAVVKGISGAASLGITVEPVGGSRVPTLPTVAAAQLNA